MIVMTRISKALVWTGLLLPLFAQADGDLIIKNAGSFTVKPGASIIVGPNQIVDIQAGGIGRIEKDGTVDGNVTVRSGALLVLCGEITGDLLALGQIGDCRLRTDALIGKKRGRLSGNNRYSRTGAGRPFASALDGRGVLNFYIAGQNDAFVDDGLKFRAKLPKGDLNLSVNRITGGRSNVTAQFVRSAYVDPEVPPGKTLLFQVAARAGTRSAQERIYRFTADVTSIGDGNVSDRVTAEITQPATSPSRPLPADRGR